MSPKSMDFKVFGELSRLSWMVVNALCSGTLTQSDSTTLQSINLMAECATTWKCKYFTRTTTERVSRAMVTSPPSQSSSTWLIQTQQTLKSSLTFNLNQLAHKSLTFLSCWTLGLQWWATSPATLAQTQCQIVQEESAGTCTSSPSRSHRLNSTSSRFLTLTTTFETESLVPPHSTGTDSCMKVFSSIQKCLHEIWTSEIPLR